MIRLLMIMALMAGTAATAQEAAKDQDDDMETSVAEASQQEDDDDDDDDDEEGSDEAGVHEAGAKFDFGFPGVMARDNRTQLAPLTLAAGQPVASAEYTLKSGGYYRMDINADGSQELALSGGDFFRAIWVNEVVIEDIEIRPMGLHSLEFDDAGTATISFVAVTPGRYTLSIPGSSGATQEAVFNIR